MNEHVGQSMSSWFMWAFGISMIASFILWLIFAQFSMRRIERDMKASGLPNTFVWDGLGGRIIFYACAIALPERVANRVDSRLINSPLIRSYASRADRIRAQLFLVCLGAWIVIGFYGFLFGTD